MNIQDIFPLGLTGWISCSPRESQESSPKPQFKSISASALSFLYVPALTSIHDYWKNHSFDYTDLCRQSDVSALQYTVYICHSCPSKKQASFNFMAAVTILSVLFIALLALAGQNYNSMKDSLKLCKL